MCGNEEAKGRYEEGDTESVDIETLDDPGERERKGGLLSIR